MSFLDKLQNLSVAGEDGKTQNIDIPCPEFNVTLSHWDRIFPPTPSKRILCFRMPGTPDDKRIIRCLDIAHQHIIRRFPPLAGSLVPLAPDQGGRPWLRDIVPQGFSRLVIRDLSDRYSFAELAKQNFPQHLLKTEDFVPLPKVAYVTEDPIPVCRIQANFINGGLLLVFSIMHIVADGKGVSDIIEMFANNFRKATFGELDYPDTEVESVYHSDRTKIVNGDGFFGNLQNHAAYTASPVNTHKFIVDRETPCQTFRIPAALLSALKKAASVGAAGPDDWISTGDAIAGLIWRSVMIARYRAGILPEGELAVLTQPVDCRSHLGLKDYFGNMLYMTKAGISLEALANPEEGLGTAARKIRSDLKAVTADKFKDLVAYAERVELESHTRLSIIEALPTGGLILTNHFKFAMHGLDFGPLLGDGHVHTYRLPAKGFMAGAAMVMPALKDGSCEIVLTEREETIKFMLQDELWSRYTKKENATPITASHSVVSIAPPSGEVVSISA